MKKIVVTDKAPAAIGPYSQGVWAGNLLFLSGQIPLDPQGGTIVGTTAAEQAEQVFRNIGGALESQGLTFENVVKATVFAKNMEDFGAVNQVYATRFSAEPPARSFVEVARLPKDVLVEIEVIAYKP